MSVLNLFRNSDRAVAYQPGQVIFKEGEAADFMYVVIEGTVDILVHGKVIDTTEPGGVLGEMSLVDKAPRSATTVAKTECKVVPVDERQFNFLVSETPGFALKVMRMMCARLRQRFPELNEA